MDMQNVKNLTIPEGDVKTIHDKDSRLLWGAVGYDTKYAGDTFQQTYSGKNLFDKSLYIGAYQSGYTELYDGIKVATTVGRSLTAYSAIQIPNSDSLLGKTVTLKIGSKIPSNNGSKNVVVYQSKGAASVYGQPIATLYEDTSQATFTFPASYTDDSTCFAILFYCNSANVDDYTEYKNIQLEVGSTATSYEPYVGGTASPNPDYPQDIQVVTGEQTVSITDGTNTQNFTVDLGSIELCKIGTYQDYIYKSGDDWYVHKEIDSGTLTGTTTGMTVSQQSGTGRFNIVLPTSWTGYKHQTNSILAFCNSYHLVGQSEYNSGFDNVVTDMSYALNFNSGGGNALRVKNVDATTVQEMKDSMTATPLVLYYALATATDTKITDSTLIGQLNAIHEWLTRYGYQASVTGNLPMIISQTDLNTVGENENE